MFFKSNIINKVLPLLLFTNAITAQVKIGENPGLIDSSSLLELESDTRTLVISRVSSTQMQDIDPLEGAMVYNTDIKCVFYFNGSIWDNLCDGGSGSAALVDNKDGTYTYTDETGVTEIIDTNASSNPYDNTTSGLTATNLQAAIDEINASSASGSATLTDNGDGTYDFTDASGAITIISDTSESTMKDNMNGTYTFTNETGNPTTIRTGILGGDHVGTAGSVFFANSSTGAPFEDNENFFWDNTNKRLGIGNVVPRSPLDVSGVITSGRIHNGRGDANYPGYHFQDNSSTGMFSILTNILGFSTNGQEAMRIIENGNVGIQVENPIATLHVGGDLRVDGTIFTSGGSGKTTPKKPKKIIRRLSSAEVTLNLTDETLILEETVSKVVLPIADKENTGILYVLKNLGNKRITLNLAYRNLKNQHVKYLDRHSVLWLQSDGKEWQQIK